MVSSTATDREAVLRALGCSSGSSARSLSCAAPLLRPLGVTAEEGRSQAGSAPLTDGRSYGSHHLLAPFGPFATASSLHASLSSNAAKPATKIWHAVALAATKPQCSLCTGCCLTYVVFESWESSYKVGDATAG